MISDIFTGWNGLLSVDVLSESLFGFGDGILQSIGSNSAQNKRPKHGRKVALSFARIPTNDAVDGAEQIATERVE